MARRLALVAPVLAALVLSLPALARADTYCVNFVGCAGTTEPDLQTALDAAAATTTVADTVEVGTPGAPISGGYHYTDGGNAANQVSIVGAGRASTLLTSLSGSGLFLNGSGSTLSHLTVQAPAGGNYGIQTSGSLSDVDITSADPGTGSQTGVYFYGPNSSWTGGTLTLPTGSGNQTGVYASTPGVAYTLQDVSINAEDTPVLGAQGSLTLRRVSIVGGVGIVAEGEQAVADNVTFRQLPTGSGFFVDAESTGSLDTTVSLNHVSAFGNAGSSDLGLIVGSGNPGRSVTATIRNSIFRNFFFSIDRSASASGASSNVNVSYSDIELLHSLSNNNSGGTGATTSGAGNIDTDPLWVNAPEADFALKPGSAAIDAGDPAGVLPGESATDIVGAPRIAGARTDMGAVELQPPPPPPPPDTAAPTFKTSKLPTKLTLKKLLAGITFTIAPSEPSSIDASLLGSASSVKLAKSYNFTLAHRKLGLSAAKRRVTLKVRKKLLGRSRKFSLQLKIVATDASGNARTLKRTIKVR
jgi:hypothetical protein